MSVGVMKECRCDERLQLKRRIAGNQFLRVTKVKKTVSQTEERQEEPEGGG
jgi:hypothetical protein